MVVMPLTFQGATQFNQSLVKGLAGLSQGRDRFSKALHCRIASHAGNHLLPLDEFSDMAVVVLYPVRQKDPQFFNI